jgi:hypothetical protein
LRGGAAARAGEEERGEEEEEEEEEEGRAATRATALFDRRADSLSISLSPLLLSLCPSVSACV